MNYHSDDWIMQGIREHYNEALEYFPEDRIVCLILAGSQNYGLDTETSDIDTKLIITPTFRDLAMNRQPISTTHVRADNSHTDWKDIRLYCQTFRKCNLNFLEVLFSPYAIVNPLYKTEWDRLVEARELITHYDPVRAIKSMQGVAYTKYKQLENESPSHIEAIEKFGYSPKELHHLFRVKEYITRYIDGEPYSSCLISNIPTYLKAVKNGHFTLEEARLRAKSTIDHIDRMCEDFLKNCNNTVNESVNELLDDVQYNIMKIAIESYIFPIRKELWGNEAIQGDNNEVFSLMQSRTIDALNNGQSVVYDATNITRKDRASIIAICQKFVKIECHIIWAPIETCIERDATRERTVGQEVIDKMLKRFQAVYYDEGIDDIEVIHQHNSNRFEYANKIMEIASIPHDNPHHTLDIFEHCRAANKYIVNKTGDYYSDVGYAAWFHDIGKPYVKAFVDSKGNPCEVAHYYQHHCVGAWMSYGMPYVNIHSAWLISVHMDPFLNTKYYNNLPAYLKTQVDLLHEADLAGH